MVKASRAHSFSLDSRWSSEVLAHGFTAIPNLLLKHRNALGITTTELYVFLTLESYRWDNKNLPFPSLDSISMRTGLHRQTVYRSIKRLEERNLILKHRRYSQSTEYDLSPADTQLREVLDIINQV